MFKKMMGLEPVEENVVRTVSDVVADFTREFEEIELVQHNIAQEQIKIADEATRLANEATAEANKAAGAVTKFKELFSFDV